MIKLNLNEKLFIKFDEITVEIVQHEVRYVQTSPNFSACYLRP